MTTPNSTFTFHLEFMNGIMGSCRATLPGGDYPLFSEYGEMSYKEVKVNSSFHLMDLDFAMKLVERFYMSGLITHEMDRTLDGLYFDGEKATLYVSGLQKPEYKILDGVEFIPDFTFHSRYAGYVEDPEGWDGDPVEIRRYVLGEGGLPF